MVEVLVNRCYGGYGLSIEALIEIGKRIGHSPCVYTMTEFSHQSADGKSKYIRVDGTYYEHRHRCVVAKYDMGEIVHGDKELYANAITHYDFERTDETVIDVVRNMGASANGQYAELEIVDIPSEVDYYIDDYDGVETIREHHNTW